MTNIKLKPYWNYFNSCLFIVGFLLVLNGCGKNPLQEVETQIQKGKRTVVVTQERPSWLEKNIKNLPPGKEIAIYKLSTEKAPVEFIFIESEPNVLVLPMAGNQFQMITDVETVTKYREQIKKIERGIGKTDSQVPQGGDKGLPLEVGMTQGQVLEKLGAPDFEFQYGSGNDCWAYTSTTLGSKLGEAVADEAANTGINAASQAAGQWGGVVSLSGHAIKKETKRQVSRQRPSYNVFFDADNRVIGWKRR